jgi:endoglucanase
MTRIKLFGALIVPLLFLFGGSTEAEAQGMTPIKARDTPAHLAARRFMRGVNLGNYLEYLPGDPARNQTYSVADFALIRAEGFDHVRLPVAWHLYAGPATNFTLSSSIFTSVDSMVNLALNQGLSVILNLHQFTAFMSDPAGNTNELNAIWRQVAAHYSNAPPELAFELLNEPNGNATTAVMNRAYPEVIRQIRLTNPNRTLLLGPGQWNGLDEIKIGSGGLILPDYDTNLIAAVHCYDPYYFTHQGAEWALPDTATTGVLFTGPPPVQLTPNSSITHSWVLDWFRDYNTKPATINPSSPYAFRGKLQAAHAWSEYYGRPVHVGEFGCYQKADAQSRVKFYKEIRAVMDQQGLGWAMWDWKAGFHYIKLGQPDPPGMRDALFPVPQLRSQRSGTIQWDGALSKTYRVELSTSLTPPISWQSVSTQTVVSLLPLSYDIQTNAAGPVFVRVQWVK